MIGLRNLLCSYCIAVFLLLAGLSNAALSIQDLQKGISTESPIYNVQPGQLETVLSSLKDYNMIMIITTSEPKYACEMCGQLDPIMVKIAQSIYKNDKSMKDSLFFVRVEAAENLPFLKSLGVGSVPQIWGFPNSKIVLGDRYDKVQALMKEYETAIREGLPFETPDWYNVKQGGMEHYIFELAQGDSWDVVVEKLAGFISNTIKKDVRDLMFSGLDGQNKGFDWTVTIQWFIYVFVGIKVYQKLRTKSDEANAVSFWRDKKLCAYLSIVLIFINLSGFNFTMQRQVPFISQRDGKILWIAPVSNTQFGSEIGISIVLQILFVIVLFGLVSFSQFSDSGLRDIVMTTCALSLAALLLIGAKIYQIKSPAYPLDYLGWFLSN